MNHNVCLSFCLTVFRSFHKNVKNLGKCHLLLLLLNPSLPFNVGVGFQYRWVVGDQGQVQGRIGRGGLEQFADWRHVGPIRVILHSCITIL